jgi:hypothetical protein
MITLAITTAGIFLLAGVVAIFHAAGHAPEGYEDELGFHARVQPVPAKMLAVAVSARSAHATERA